MPGSVIILFMSRPSYLSLHYVRFFWPAEEPIQDHSGSVGGGMVVNNNYQNFSVQPTEVLLR